MNKGTKLAIALATYSVMTVASADTLISNWDYITEAGFQNSTTGDAVVIGQDSNSNDVFSTLDPVTLVPLSSTGVVVAPADGNMWIQNEVDSLFYNYGSAGSQTGTSESGLTAGAAGQGLSSILSGGSTYDTTCWGHGPSCLSFTDADGNDTSRVEGTATTNGGFNDGTQLSHDNAPTGAPSLTTIQVVDGLSLFSTDLIAGVFELPELTFDVVFNETFANSGDFFPFAPDDAFIFTLTGGPGVSFGADYIDFTVPMDLTGLVGAGFHTDYQVVTRLSGLQTVTTPSGLRFGFITPENMRNTLNVAFEIRAVGIPEPGSLAIFGMVLLGLAGARKLKK
ncbi:MAG: hypothetical protein ACI88A_000544 [Paraglaciecola sp.]|jgi:hypothetical protein